MSPRTLVLLASPRCRLSIAANVMAGAGLWEPDLDCDLAIGFSPPLSGWPAPVEWDEADATTRLTWPEDGGRVALVGIQSLSSLGPLMMWDLAHACPIGGEVLLIDREAALAQTPFDLAYYAGWLETVEQTPGRRLFRKTALSPAEQDSGLDRWSFCLPMGRPDARTIKRLLDRIAGLGLTDTEVLIACPDEYAAALPDGVRHVPTGAAATLTAKKNALARAASLPNLCIFHDRLLPPRNFRQAVEAFGDAYPLTGFQNILIDPRDGAIARYSDYHAEFGPGATHVAATGGTARLYGELLDLRQNWRSQFVEGSIFEYSPNFYLTGSLYLAKRSVWRMCGQDEAIDWGSLEDVEFGRRAIDRFGIPMRINPFAFARSERLRPIVAEGARHHAEDSFEDHALRPGQAALLAPEGGLPSVFGISQDQYRERLLAFSDRWATPLNLPAARRHIALARLTDMQDLAGLLVTLIYLCAVRRDEAELRDFLRGVGGQLLLSPMDRAAETGIVSRVMQGKFLVDELVRSSYLTDLLLAGEKRRLFTDADPDEDAILISRLMEAWSDSRHGLTHPGGFEQFVVAVRAAL